MQMPLQLHDAESGASLRLADWRLASQQTMNASRRLALRNAKTMNYVELHGRSAFSFLRGGSSPEELAAEAARLELGALALCDATASTARSGSTPPA